MHTFLLTCNAIISGTIAADAPQAAQRDDASARRSTLHRFGHSLRWPQVAREQSPAKQ
jgi:hypothetical protein